jgi:ubiquinol-cytochrome c reductase cytochrome c subunit
MDPTALGEATVMRLFDLRSAAAIIAGLALASPASAAGSAEKGKQAFMKYGCWQCHGFVGQGSVAGSKLAPNPMPLEAMSVFVRNTNGSMPPYGKAVLPDEDLADIHAYLLSQPKSPDPNTIPLLTPQTKN